MAGEYREASVLEKLPKKLSDAIRGGLRIAFTDGPLDGVKVRKDLAEEMATAYETAGLMKYANGLRDGSMVPLIPSPDPYRYWEPGELFLRS
jgi:hypothetical protein